LIVNERYLNPVKKSSLAQTVIKGSYITCADLSK
jgi:hypothetical protein